MSTDDLNGRIVSYVGHGEFTDAALKTFGRYGVMRVPHVQALQQFISQYDFEHHGVVTRGSVAPAIAEAFENYLGWDVYRHHAE